MQLRLTAGCTHLTTHVPEEENLARAVWLSAGLSAPPLCGGLGRCGLCRVRFVPESAAPAALDDEVAVLGRATEQGWRLACRHTAGSARGAVLEIPARENETGEMVLPQTRLSGVLRLAVDLGTTSVQWQALDARGAVVAYGQGLNPQAGAGGDIVSRLGVAANAEGRHRLSALARDFVRTVVAALEGAGARVGEICLAANTAMSAIFLDQSVQGLLAAPYSLPLRGGECATLPDLPPLWIPPQPAPFVGGDLCAAMAWALNNVSAFPFLLADMGTNGECVLALDDQQALITSVPLGPALEGVGLACGGLAGPGSVTGFSLGGTGLLPTVMGGGAPRALSGTGALSLLDALRRAGVLTEEGTLGTPAMPLGQRLLARVLHTADGWRLPLPPEDALFLGAADVESLLKVRAAFAVAVASLLEAAGMEASRLRGLLLAGSLGEHADIGVLERLGFLPSTLGGRVRAVGNAALAGAGLFLVRPQWRERMTGWSERCRLVNVTSMPDFTARYVAAMRLAPW